MFPAGFLALNIRKKQPDRERVEAGFYRQSIHLKSDSGYVAHDEAACVARRCVFFRGSEGLASVSSHFLSVTERRQPL